jgi:hypothetical protein
VQVRKGGHVGGCQILGLGPEPTAPPVPASCVPSCGGFDENQSIRKVETFKFKGCEVTFEFDLATGAVLEFDVTGIGCTPFEGDVSELQILGPNFQEFGTFGDGWISSGENSCTTRLIGGRYYTVCQ